ncbi:MAG: aldo/keto reductase [Deltaproteobacteria bacterium]
MRYRTIAGSDVQVSEVGFGVWTMATGWWGQYTDEQSTTLLRQSFDRGITFFDTADTYGNGRGETALALAFPGADRQKIVIGTKFGYDWKAAMGERREGHREAPHRLDIPFLEQALDDSLERLGTDYIDVWQLHNVRGDHLREDALWTFLDKVRASGKVRSIGVALGPAIGWLDEGLYSMRDRPVDTVQMIYNALELTPGRELIAAARETGRSLLVRVPHSSGMLEGKYDANTTFDANDHRNHRPKAWLTNGLQKIQQLDFLTNGTGRTLGQAALRYVLHDPTVVSALPNIYNLEQVDEFCGASDVADLTADETARIQALFETNYGLPREVEQAVARP